VFARACILLPSPVLLRVYFGLHSLAASGAVKAPPLPRSSGPRQTRSPSAQQIRSRPGGCSSSHVGHRYLASAARVWLLIPRSWPELNDDQAVTVSPHEAPRLPVQISNMTSADATDQRLQAHFTLCTPVAHASTVIRSTHMTPPPTQPRRVHRHCPIRADRASQQRLRETAHCRKKCWLYMRTSVGSIGGHIVV
jgi:hypothetical protein